jgi:hypothetical protein
MYKVVHYHQDVFKPPKLQCLSGLRRPKGRARAVVSANVPIDRTGVGNLLDMQYEEIAIVPNGWNKSFEQCALERAEDLWNMGKPINVFYSGGIDSSVAWIALLETKPDHLDLNAHYSYHSIEEFPELHEKTIKDPPLSSDQFIHGSKTLFENHDILKVTGVCGDQIFLAGTGVSGGGNNYEIEDWQKQPWESIFELGFIEDKKLKIKLAEFLFKQVADYIITIFDLYWWIQFSLHWEHFDIQCIFAKTPATKSTQSFFNSVDFQCWAIYNQINNPSIKMPGNASSYKQEAKEFIHKYFPNETYRKYKLKEASLKRPLREAFHDYETPEKKARRWTDDNLKLVLTDGRYWRMNEEIPQDVLDQITLL